MKKLILSFTLFALVLACGSEDKSDNLASKRKKAPAKKEVSGEKVYKKNCVVCHGVYGDMGASGALNLQESELSVEERIMVLNKGRNTMPAYEGVLSEEEIQAVAEYTLTLKK